MYKCANIHKHTGRILCFACAFCYDYSLNLNTWLSIFYLTILWHSDEIQFKIVEPIGNIQGVPTLASNSCHLNTRLASVFVPFNYKILLQQSSPSRSLWACDLWIVQWWYWRLKFSVFCKKSKKLCFPTLPATIWMVSYNNFRATCSNVIHWAV